MEKLFSLLSDDELEKLDEILLGRIDEDADMRGKDEGVLSISELDGLLTAVVSGPVLVPPSQWVAAIWGDVEPGWNNEQEFEEIIVLMIRHMNGIASTLLEEPHNFEPLFLERVVDGEVFTIVDDWCHGYMRGVVLSMDKWDAGGEEVSSMLLPIMTFASEKTWEAVDEMSDAEKEAIREAIVPCARDIYAWWLERREDEDAMTATVDNSFQTTEPLVGRDTPCFCGSGKKFKKCCLH